MEIAESFIKGKREDQTLCEDMLFINDDFILVADGVTAKSDTKFHGKTGGRAAAEKVCEAVAGFPKDINVYDAVKLMTERVASLYTAEKPLGAASVGVIIFSKFKNEIWSIGDCQCFINDDFFSHEKEIDGIVSDMRALVLEMGRRDGKTDEELAEKDIGREFILPVIKKQEIFANAGGKFSYGVINGATVHQKDIVVHKVKKGDEIILASDGYPKLLRTLAESEERLKEEIKNNPLCDGDYRSTKGIKKEWSSFDDRTYIRFKV